MKNYFLAVLSLLLTAIPLSAQSLWTTVEAETKIVGDLDAFVEAEFRTYDGMESTERWAGTIGLDYKISKFLKANAGYSYIHQQREAKLNNEKDRKTFSYWQPRHRGFFSLTGSLKWNNFEFSLRERYQYTYRSEKTAETVGINGNKGERLIVGEGKHILRSRLEVEYKIKKCDITPFISYELYSRLQNAMATDKMRYTAGASYKINKKHSFNAYYRYIDHSDDDEEAGHVIGVGYKIKL